HTLIITHQGNSQVKNCKIELLTQEYEKFSISSKETIDSGFTRINSIVTSLKSLDLDYYSKNHVRKFIRTLPLKWRAKVMAIEESKDLATLPLDELIGNLKVNEMVLDNDGGASKTTKEMVKSLSLKAKVTREQTSDDSDSQRGSDEDVDEEEEAEAFNLMARNFCKFFRKGNRFGRSNRFSNGANRFGRGLGNIFRNKGGESSRQKGACYNYGIEGHFASECRKPKENKAFVEEAWSDSENGDEPQNDATCLMAIGSEKVQSNPFISNNDLDFIDFQKENEKLLRFNKDFAKTFEKLLNEKYSFESENSKLLSKINDLEFDCNVSRLQDEALNFLKFKKSSIVLDDMLSRQKLFQDKEDLRFSKNDKTTSVCLKCDLFPDDWIVDSGCTKYMTKNRRLFTSYKVYDVGHVRSWEQPKGQGYSQTSKAYIVLNKETIRIEESLNVTFNESLPEPKSSPSVEDDRIIEPVVQNPVRSRLLEANDSEPGYPKSLKEAKGHPIEQIISELNGRTLRSKTKQA
ncbi:retrovirus-related pol polyprotein from transposon TNT 1-94, partial [Tanacetum coccineum]